MATCINYMPNPTQGQKNQKKKKLIYLIHVPKIPPICLIPAPFPSTQFIIQKKTNHLCFTCLLKFISQTNMFIPTWRK